MPTCPDDDPWVVVHWIVRHGIALCGVLVDDDDQEATTPAAITCLECVELWSEGEWFDAIR